MQDDSKSNEKLIRELRASLREVNDRLDVITAFVTDHMSIMDRHHNILWANNAAISFFGQELAGRKCYAAYHGRDTACEPCIIEEVFRDGQTHEGETTVADVTGTERPFWCTASVTSRFEDDRPKTAIAIWRDVTDRQRARERVRTSEERLRGFAERSQDMMFAVNTRGEITYVSRASRRIFGYEPEEMVGKHFKCILAASEIDRMVHKFEQCLQSRNAETFEFQVVRRNGRSALVQFRGAVIVKDNQVTGVEGVLRDITEDKKAQQQLRESEDTFRTIFQSAADGIVLANTETRQFYLANKVFCNMLGYEPEEIESLSVSDIHPEQDLSRIMEQFGRQTRRESSLSRDMPLKRRDGTIFYTDVNAFPVILGGTEYLMGVFRDATDRRATEEALRESEGMMRALLNASRDSVLLLDTDIRILAINSKAALELAGKPEELVGLAYAEAGKACVCPEVLASRIVRAKKVIESGRPAHFLDENNGRLAETSMHPVLNSTGQVDRLAFFIRDVTDQRRMERALVDSEAKYRLLVEHIPAVSYVAEFDNRSTTTYVSPQVEKILGFSPADYAADPEIWSKRLHNDDRERVLSELASCHRTGRPFSCQYRMVARDGRIVCFQDEGRVVQNADGRPQIHGVMLDVTQRKQYEQAIYDSEEKYKTVVESAGEAIATVDSNGVFLFMNGTAAERLGGKPDEFVGKTMWDLFPKEIADRQVGSIRAAIEMQHGSNVVVLTDLHGQMRWYNTTIEPLRNSDGKVAKALVIARDIHAIKLAEEELREYREKMARAEQLASLGTLSAMLAHELTQPLTVIRLSIENSLADIRGSSCPASVAEDLKDALSEVGNATSIVDRFRSFARKSTEDSVSDVGLKPVAERVVRFLGESARRAKVALRIEGMDSLPPVRCNEKELEQMFFALAENAIQAADSREVRELVISGTASHGKIKLKFSDSCGGIAPESITDIFEPFFTTKPAGEGTGLGLCIVQRIAARAGGEVKVKSDFGVGSTFVVTLPQSRTAVSEDTGHDT